MENMEKPTTFKPELTGDEILVAEKAIKRYIECGGLTVNEARSTIAAFDKFEAAYADFKARLKDYYDMNPDACD